MAGGGHGANGPSPALPRADRRAHDAKAPRTAPNTPTKATASNDSNVPLPVFTLRHRRKFEGNSHWRRPSHRSAVGLPMLNNPSSMALFGTFRDRASPHT